MRTGGFIPIHFGNYSKSIAVSENSNLIAYITLKLNRYWQVKYRLVKLLSHLLLLIRLVTFLHFRSRKLCPISLTSLNSLFTLEPGYAQLHSAQVAFHKVFASKPFVP